MTVRKLIFKEGNTEVVLPVTPPEYEVSTGVNMETINIHSVGDVVLPGYGTLMSQTLSVEFPSTKRPYMNPGTQANPRYYTDKFEQWCKKRTKLRFIVSDTNINIPIYIEQVSKGEDDGTNDVKADIGIREYRDISLKPLNQSSSSSNASRPADSSASKSTITYKIKKGDTLSAICRKHYGKSSLYNKLAKYNKIKNPNLIFAGNTLKIPPVNKL